MKKAVLLINIGSPDEIKVSAVRKYLQKFLMDGRVLDIPFLARFLLVNGIIAPFRAIKSHKAYKHILIHNQSPLTYYSLQLEKKLQQILGIHYVVKTAMLYGKPYLSDILKEIQHLPFSEIIIIPLYPQYASSTTGSALEKVFKEIKNWLVIPNIKTLHTFYHHPEFIDVWAKHIKKHLPENYDFILFSYHGLPIHQILKADKQFSVRCCRLNDCCNTITLQNSYCYRMNCLQTTQLITEKLALNKNKTASCFQSRLGKSEWLQPYAIDFIKKLAEEGIKNLVIVAPSFVVDCLETLFEIQIEYTKLFQLYGGQTLKLIPSLNTEEDWIYFLYKKITE